MIEEAATGENQTADSAPGTQLELTEQSNTAAEAMVAEGAPDAPEPSPVETPEEPASTEPPAEVPASDTPETV